MKSEVLYIQYIIYRSKHPPQGAETLEWPDDTQAFTLGPEHHYDEQIWNREIRKMEHDYLVERGERKCREVYAPWREVEVEIWWQTGGYEKPMQSPKAIVMSDPAVP